MSRGFHLDLQLVWRPLALLTVVALASHCSKDSAGISRGSGSGAPGGAPSSAGSGGTRATMSSGNGSGASNQGGVTGSSGTTTAETGGVNSGGFAGSSGGFAGSSGGAAGNTNVAVGGGGAPAADSGGSSSGGAAEGVAGSNTNGAAGANSGGVGGSSGSGAMGSSGMAGAGGAMAVTFPSNLPADDGVGHFHHVHLNVVDPAATMAFFTQWWTGEVTALPGGRPALWTQASWILFDQVDTPAPSAIISSIYHIGWTVLDVQKSYAAMVAGGVPFDTPLSDISTVFGGTGGAQFAYATGPDHELVEFYNGSDDHFRHVHFVSDDPVSAGQWYQKHFGAVSMTANPSRATGSVNGRQVRPNMSVTIDAITVWWYPTGFVQATYPDDWQGRTALAPQRGRVIDHIALSVENLPAALTRLQGEGVQVLEAPAWRMDGAFISAFVQGPDDVDVEVVQGRAMHP
jgi:catechol 2,3-dioxygenase-like lactoylglutathione lyase family enzyme